jgi:hypothetical protein
MVEADIGDDRDQRLQNIGRVQTSAQTDFDYANLDLLAGEVLEGQRRY